MVYARPMDFNHYPYELPCDFGPYRLESRIGEGGMGTVFMGLELESLSYDVRVETAVKVPDAKLLRNDPTMADQFIREARAAATVRHPAVVALKKVGQVHGIPYLAMEFLQGEGLEKALARGPLPPAEVLHISVELCRGLQAVHNAGMVHRDLKPSNVFRTSHGEVKLLDLGIAKAMDAATRMTGTGMSRGTPGYMAPEQLEDGAELDGRTDLFALGATIAELALGEPIFVGDTLIALMMIMSNSEAHVARQSVGSRVDIACPGLGDIVVQCLRQSPEQRPASANEVESLLRALGGLEPSPPVPAAQSKPSPEVATAPAPTSVPPKAVAATRAIQRPSAQDVAAAEASVPRPKRPARGPVRTVAVPSVQAAKTADTPVPGSSVASKAGAAGLVMGTGIAGVAAGGLVVALAMVAGFIGLMIMLPPPEPDASSVEPEKVAIALEEGEEAPVVDNTDAATEAPSEPNSRGWTNQKGDEPAPRPTTSAASVEDVETPPAEVGMGQLRVWTDPPGATVTIADKVMGRTPVALDIAQGQHTLNIELDGYSLMTKKVTVAAERDPDPPIYELTENSKPGTRLWTKGESAKGKNTLIFQGGSARGHGDTGPTQAASTVGADCPGFVEKEPSFRIELTKHYPSLRLSAIADDVQLRRDIILVVSPPTGPVVCVDDSSGKGHSAITKALGPGIVTIWVGKFKKAGWTKYDLTVTET